MSAAEQHVLPPESKGLAVFDPFRAELAKLVETNKSIVFDYRTRAGMDSARSYIYQLRRTKKPVDDAHKAAKAEALAFTRRLDSERNEIIGTIDEMIEQHARPIKEAEEQEAERVANHRKVVDFILTLTPPIGSSVADIKALQKKLAAVVVDDTLEEFEADARAEWLRMSDIINRSLADAERREAEEAELAVLRAEKARRDQQDREAEIARQAAEKAKADAEAAAARERQAAEDAQRLAVERAERAEADARAADERAAKAAQEAQEREARIARDTEERLRLEAEQRAADDALALAKREADREHKAAVNREIAAALAEHAAILPEQARTVVMAIAKGQIPHLTIAY